MFLALIAATEVTQTVPMNPATAVITAETVELTGAGKLEFKPDLSSFHVDPPAGSGNGLSFTVRLWLDPTGKPVSCDQKNAVPAKAAQTACAQLTRSARFILMPGMALPLRRGFVDVRFSFFRDPPGGPKGLHMFASPKPAYANIPINYPPDDAPADRKLDPASVTLNFAVAQDDYPVVAMRYELESSSTIRIGVTRDGIISDCRPVDGPGLRTAYLDNYTCELFLKRARIDFSRDAPKYEGLRYITKRMGWHLPR